MIDPKFALNASTRQEIVRTCESGLHCFPRDLLLQIQTSDIYVTEKSRLLPSLSDTAPFRQFYKPSVIPHTTSEDIVIISIALINELELVPFKIFEILLFGRLYSPLLAENYIP